MKYIKLLFKHENIVQFLSIVFSGGIICGFLLSYWLDIDILSAISSSMFSTVLSEVDRSQFFLSQFTTNIVICAVILFLGFSIIGMPFIAFIIFTKGVQIGFSSVMYLFTYQLQGIIGIVLTLIPQIIFEAIAVFIIGIIAFHLSFNLFKRTFFNTKAIVWKEIVHDYLNTVLFGLALVLFSCILKSTLVLYLIEVLSLTSS